MGKRELAGALFNEGLLRSRAEAKLIEAGYRLACGEWTKQTEAAKSL